MGCAKPFSFEEKVAAGRMRCSFATHLTTLDRREEQHTSLAYLNLIIVYSLPD
jgi:hypothetical protein